MIKRKIRSVILISSLTLCTVTFLLLQDSFAGKYLGVQHNEALDHARHIKIKMSKKLRHERRHHNNSKIRKYEKKEKKARMLVKVLKRKGHEARVKCILKDLGIGAAAFLKY